MEDYDAESAYQTPEEIGQMEIYSVLNTLGLRKLQDPKTHRRSCPAHRESRAGYDDEK